MKNYIAHFQNDSGIDSQEFKAANLTEAKKYAQAYKRRTFASKMRTTVKRSIKITN